MDFASTSFESSDLITPRTEFDMQIADKKMLEKNDVWSAVKICVFCYVPLKGESKLLKCLHIICNNCVTKEKIGSSIRCKCHTVTEGEFIECHVVSPDTSAVKICNENDCNTVANKICLVCQIHHCKPHSKVHECVDNNHKLILTYPLKDDVTLCPFCKKYNVDVYCVVCSVLICSLCHLRSHQTHKYKQFDELNNEIRSKLASEKNGLYVNNITMDHYLSITENLIKNLLTNKRSINEDIDKNMKILYDEIDKRTSQLKKTVEDYFFDSVDKINEKKQIFNDIKKQNQYYVDFIEFVSNHGKTNDLVNLSGTITNRLINFKKDISKISFENMSNVRIDLKCNFDKNLENCTSSIKEVGHVFSLSSPVLNFSKNYKTKTADNVSQASENLPVVDYIISDSDGDSSSENEPIVECSCCNQLSYKLIECSSCERSYHGNCHIPSLPEGSTIYSALEVNWTCTMCENITACSTVSSRNNLPGYTDETERKIINRILMEIYCNNDDSECFRECLPEQSYPEYYKKIINPISLNDIKKRLESNESYSSLTFFVNDLNRVFSNAISYYPVSDPCHKSAMVLKNRLHEMLTKWIPTSITSSIPVYKKN